MLPRQRTTATVESLMIDMVIGLGRSENDLSAIETEARQDFKAFCTWMESDYVEGGHLDDLRWTLAQVEAGILKRVIITMPPRHSKSLHVSENFPAWYLGRHPNHRIIAASHTQRLANRFSRSVQRKMRDQRYPFPEVSISRDNAGIQDWAIEGFPTGGYVCVGVGGAPTGVGGNVIIIDDPIRNQEDADSEVIREKLWEWYTGTMYTRRQPGCAIIVTATRWHEDDLTGRLLAAEKEGGEKWFHLYLPAIDEEGEYLWPEYYPPREYQLAQMANDRVWNAQYMGRPFDAAGNLMRREWFHYAPYGERYIQIIQAWDCAAEPGVSNDYSACITLGVGLTHYDVLDVWEDKVIFPDLEQACKDRYTWAKAVWPNLPISVVIERANAGVQLLQNLGRETNMPVTPYDIPSGKNPKRQRVIGMTPLMKANRVRVLREQAWINRLLGQCAAFPTGTNDDLVDAFMISLVYATGIGNAPVATSRRYDDEPEPDEISPRPSRRQTAIPPRA